MDGSAADSIAPNKSAVAGLGRTAAVLAAGAVHLAVLFAPALVRGPLADVLGDPVLACFALLATCFYLVEALGSSAADAGLPGRSEAPSWLPGATGLVLLLVFWTGIVERIANQPTVDGPVAVLIAVAGGAFFVAGIWLRHRAIRELSSWFVSEVRVVPGQPLVTHGLYARLRHPSEAGNLCLGAGAALLLGGPVAGATVGLLLVPLVLWRIRLEDRLLRRHHGDAFRRYAATVPALIPKV